MSAKCWCVLVMSAVFRICGKESQPGLQILVEKLATPLHIQFCRINLSSNNVLFKVAFSVICWVNIHYRQASIPTASKTHRTISYKKPTMAPWVTGQPLKFKPNVFAFFTGNILWKQQIKKLIIIIIVTIIIYLFICSFFLR